MENNVVIIPGMETVAMLLSNHQLQYGKTGVVTQEDIIFFKHILNSTLKQYCFGGLGGTLVNISTSCNTQQEKADYARDVLLPAMAKVRSAADALEQITDASLWPIPSYTQLLFH